jgi:hypothetical protein
MSRDITDRLIELAKPFDGLEAGRVIREAADEIERLRDALIGAQVSGREMADRMDRHG